MRASFTSAIAVFFALVLNLSAAHAQAVFASSVAITPSPRVTSGPAADADGSTRTFTGTVVNPAGLLPGAVVRLLGTKAMAVTNANGEFSLQLPASAAVVQMTVSYAGFADETVSVSSDAAGTTLKLSTVQVVKVARKQKLKTYMKTAHRQARRSMRRL